jgi:hypothetical protein
MKMKWNNYKLNYSHIKMLILSQITKIIIIQIQRLKKEHKAEMHL